MMQGCRPLTPIEINHVLSAFEGATAARDHLLFILGLNTGLRISELLSLDVSDVWNGVQVRARVHVKRMNTKGKSKGASIALNSTIQSELRDYLALPLFTCPVDASRPLFRTQSGMRLGRKGAWQALKRAFSRAGVEEQVATHSMRKTFAKRIHNALGNDLTKTQRALRHSSILSTIHYLGVDDAEIENAIMNL